MTHNLAVIVFLAKNLLHFTNRCHRVVPATKTKHHIDFTSRAAGGSDQALAVLVQQFTVDTRLVENSVGVSGGRHAKKVVHSLGGLRQQGHVRIGAVRRHVVFSAVPEESSSSIRSRNLRGYVGFHSDNRFDSGFFRRGNEFVGRMQIAVIGYSYRRHPHFLGRRHQLIDFCGSIEN